MLYLTRKRGSGVRRVFTLKNRPTLLYNVYTPGSGVASGGSSSRSVRHALRRRASGLNRGTMRRPHTRKSGLCFCMRRF